MNILEQVKQARKEVLEAKKLVDGEKMSLLESVMSSGFIYEGNDYLGLYEHLRKAVKQPKQKRDVMFKDVESWIPSLEKYIELLKEEKKFYEELYKKQQSGSQ